MMNSSLTATVSSTFTSILKNQAAGLMKTVKMRLIFWVLLIDLMHQIPEEKYLTRDSSTRYPFCIDGKYNCPPEDCGRVDGFY